MVVVYTLLTGPTLPIVAEMLGVDRRNEPRDLDLEAAPLERIAADLLQVTITPASRLHGVEVGELRLPTGASVSMLIREGQTLVPERRTVLKRGDDMLVVTPRRLREATEHRLRDGLDRRAARPVAAGRVRPTVRPRGGTQTSMSSSTATVRLPLTSSLEPVAHHDDHADAGRVAAHDGGVRPEAGADQTYVGTLGVVGPDLGHRDLAALGGVADVALAEALVEEEAQGAVGEAAPVAGVEDGDGDLLARMRVAGGHGGRPRTCAESALPGNGSVTADQPQSHADDEQGAEHGEGDDRLEMDAHAVPRCPVVPVSAGDRVDARVQDVALLEGRAQCAVQAVLEVVLAPPLHDVREQVAVEGRVLVEQGGQLQGVLGGDQLVEPHLARRHVGPGARGQPVVGIGPPLAHALEDHAAKCKAIRDR